MSRYAVLLRGINVGGHKKVPMADLRAALTDAGFTEVATLLASGNVVLGSGKKSAPSVAAAVETVIEQTFGFTVGCIALTAKQVQAALDNDPLFPDGGDGARMLTTFSTAPGKAIAEPRKGLPAMNDGGVALGDAAGVPVAYQWCPDGISNTPELALFVGYPKTAVITGRNRNTVEKLSALLAR